MNNSLERILTLVFVGSAQILSGCQRTAEERTLCRIIGSKYRAGLRGRYRLIVCIRRHVNLDLDGRRFNFLLAMSVDCGIAITQRYGRRVAADAYIGNLCTGFLSQLFSNFIPNRSFVPFRVCKVNRLHQRLHGLNRICLMVFERCYFVRPRHCSLCAGFDGLHIFRGQKTDIRIIGVNLLNGLTGCLVRKLCAAQSIDVVNQHFAHRVASEEAAHNRTHVRIVTLDTFVVVRRHRAADGLAGQQIDFCDVILGRTVAKPVDIRASGIFNGSADRDDERNIFVFLDYILHGFPIGLQACKTFTAITAPRHVPADLDRRIETLDVVCQILEICLEIFVVLIVLITISLFNVMALDDHNIPILIIHCIGNALCTLTCEGRLMVIPCVVGQTVCIGMAAFTTLPCISRVIVIVANAIGVTIARLLTCGVGIVRQRLAAAEQMAKMNIHREIVLIEHIAQIFARILGVAVADEENVRRYDLFKLNLVLHRKGLCSRVPLGFDHKAVRCIECVSSDVGDSPVDRNCLQLGHSGERISIDGCNALFDLNFFDLTCIAVPSHAFTNSRDPALAADGQLLCAAVIIPTDTAQKFSFFIQIHKLNTIVLLVRDVLVELSLFVTVLGSIAIAIDGEIFRQLLTGSSIPVRGDIRNMDVSAFNSQFGHSIAAAEGEAAEGCDRFRQRQLCQGLNVGKSGCTQDCKVFAKCDAAQLFELSQSLCRFRAGHAITDDQVRDLVGISLPWVVAAAATGDHALAGNEERSRLGVVSPVGIRISDLTRRGIRIIESDEVDRTAVVIVLVLDILIQLCFRCPVIHILIAVDGQVLRDCLVGRPRGLDGDIQIAVFNHKGCHCIALAEDGAGHKIDRVGEYNAFQACACCKRSLIQLRESRREADVLQV